MEDSQNLKIELSHDPAIPLLGIYLTKMKTLIQKDTCIPMFMAVLFTTAKIWKQHRCQWINEWIKMWQIYSGILLSYKKVYNSAICNTMDEVGEYNSKWNKSDLERQILYNVNYSWNIKIKQMNITKEKQTHRYREQTNGY